MVREQRDIPYRGTHPGRRQSDRRRPLQGGVQSLTSKRIRGSSVEWRLLPQVCHSIFQRIDRPHIDLFASKHNHQLPTYFSWDVDPFFHGQGCPDPRLVWPSGVCLPPNRPDPAGPSQTVSNSELPCPPGSSSLAPADVVLPSPGSPCLGSSSASGEAGSPLRPGNRGNSPIPDSRRTEADSLADFGRSFLEAGLSKKAASIAQKARRVSTRTTYASRFQRFRRWCRKIPCNPYSASLGQVADFLTEVFLDGAQACTVLAYRSAVGALHHGFHNGSVQKSVFVRFNQGHVPH